MILLAFGEADFQLHTPFRKVQINRHQRVAAFLNFADQLVDLFTVQQAATQAGGVGCDVGGRAAQRADSCADEVYLLADHADIGLLDMRPPRTDGLDFPALQLKSSLVAIFNEIIKECFFIVDNAHRHDFRVVPVLARRLVRAMKHVVRSILVPHSAATMYALVNDVPSYPQFLPWCGGARIIEHTETQMQAAVDIAYLGVRQTFTTRNTLAPNERIDLALVSGPFSRLSGQWRFTQLGDLGCKVEFELNYAFDGIIGVIISPVFDRIAVTFVDSFVKRADALHPQS